MFKEVLQSINGIEIFAIISLILFFTLFILLSVKLLRMDKNYLKNMAQLPLETDNNSQNSKGE